MKRNHSKTKVLFCFPDGWGLFFFFLFLGRLSVCCFGVYFGGRCTIGHTQGLLLALFRILLIMLREPYGVPGIKIVAVYKTNTLLAIISLALRHKVCYILWKEKVISCNCYISEIRKENQEKHSHWKAHAGAGRWR